MSRIKACVALIALFAAAGCASNPEVADESAAPPTAVAAAAGSDAVVAEDAVAPVKVVDAAELIAREPPRVICREMLKPWSNVHILRCLTEENWKIWNQAEARHAAGILRTMQGNPYR